MPRRLFKLFLGRIPKLKMQVNTTQLKNKQRIYIGGNHGANKIFDICTHVLLSIKKSVDFYRYGEANLLTDSPIVIIKGAEELVDKQASFHSFEPHILLIHRVKEDLPNGYSSFEQYVSEIEKLADNLPKSGSLIYFEDDDVAILLGKKEREDVRAFSYTALEGEKTVDGFKIKTTAGPIFLTTNNDKFLKHAAGAKALLNRLGVTDDEFFKALKSFN
ncbi:MAG: UDP-N-acetylmuramate: L-alanyl-gamma-D-glutamyl-meso-diaminopimelate ligase [Marinoscillum sp.]